MYIAHYVFYVACILRGCDMATGFYTNIWIWNICFMSFIAYLVFDTDIFVILLRYFVCCVSHAFQLEFIV